MTENQTDNDTIAHAAENQNTVISEVTLTTVFENRDRDTPVFNETMYDLREQLPSLTAHGSPAAANEASDQFTDDSSDGEQD